MICLPRSKKEYYRKHYRNQSETQCKGRIILVVNQGVNHEYHYQYHAGYHSATRKSQQAAIVKEGKNKHVDKENPVRCRGQKQP